MSSKIRTRQALIAVIIAVVLVSPPAASLRAGLGDLSRPLARVLFRAGLFISPFRDNASEDTGRLRQAEALAASLAHENEALRRQLNFSQTTGFRTIGADVIGRADRVVARDVRLNRGAADGVRVDAAVIADGYLIGKVTSVTEKSAIVQLVSDPYFRLTVLVGTNPNPGLAKGSLGGVTVGRLPVTEPVNAGDMVFSSDLGQEVPPGIPLGKVTAVSVKDSVFYEAIVEVPVYLESLRTVLVVIP